MKTQQNQQVAWDAIAEQWYHFRQKPFRDLVVEIEKITKLKPGKVLEIGCGNCRNLLPFAKKSFDCYGIDFSKNMVFFAGRYCKKHKFKVKLQLGRAETLPYKNGFFDYCLSIALLHHIEIANIREKSLKEMYRVLKPKGIAFICVWNKLQPRFLFKSKDDYVRWTIKGKTYYRYYHFFTYWELKRLLEKVGFRIIDSSEIFCKNLCFLVQKV